jgi:hypothetical protein
MLGRLLPLLCVCVALAAQGGSPAVFLSFGDARPVLEFLAPILPPELTSPGVDAQAARWPDWVKQNDARTRARLERGDEDSLVNLLLFGTAFTSQLRMTARQIGRSSQAQRIRSQV